MRTVQKVATTIMKYIDIGANLTDPMFQGMYNQTVKHPPDYNNVLQRAWQSGMDKIILTVGTITEADEALKFASEDDRLYITMGCHPTRCKEFEPNPDDYYRKLCSYIDNNKNKVVAIGECGLDYDRLKFCDAATQRTYFERQLDLVSTYRLPLFLHCRNAFEDFWDIIDRNRTKIASGGVVHSFDGTLEHALKFIEFGFYIGINGCSLKTEEQLAVVAKIPKEKILLETDSPWCSIRNSHASSKHVKTTFPTVKKKEKWTENTLIDGRCEPLQIIQVLEVLAAIRNENVEELADEIYGNTMKLFFS